MIISNNNLNFYVEFNGSKLDEKITILFIHGFTGSSEDWSFFKKRTPLKYNSVFIDLIGHGKSSAPKNIKEYNEEAQVDQIKFILDALNIKKVIIIGYSMGGRLALSFAAKYQKLIEGLILESTSFGLKSKSERKNRIKNDKKLADKISNESLQDFFDYWYSLPLFSSLYKLNKKDLIKLKSERAKTNNKLGLQNSLLGFGTGTMNYHLDEFSKFKKKILLITGELDKKFSRLNILAHKKLPNSELKIVKNCGHNVHYENPEEFYKLINTFLLNMQEQT